MYSYVLVCVTDIARRCLCNEGYVGRIPLYKKKLTLQNANHVYNCWYCCKYQSSLLCQQCGMVQRFKCMSPVLYINSFIKQFLFHVSCKLRAHQIWFWSLDVVMELLQYSIKFAICILQHAIQVRPCGFSMHVIMTSWNVNIFRVTGHFRVTGQWRRHLMFSLICAWINAWVNNREAGDLRRHPVHYDVIVMSFTRNTIFYVLRLKCGISCVVIQQSVFISTNIICSTKRT